MWLPHRSAEASGAAGVPGALVSKEGERFLVLPHPFLNVVLMAKLGFIDTET